MISNLLNQKGNLLHPITFDRIALPNFLNDLKIVQSHFLVELKKYNLPKKQNINSKVKYFTKIELLLALYQLYHEFVGDEVEEEGAQPYHLFV